MRKALFLLLFVLGGVAFALAVSNDAASAAVLPPLIEQDQSGTNSNRTSQESGAEATTEQVNVNAPISILSWGSNNGDVDQSNTADTTASSENKNGTDQSVDQTQNADVASSRGTCCDKTQDGSGVSQDQSAQNDNSTEQGAELSASTSQVNVNAPVSVLSWGSNNGDVDQSNDAETTAAAKNTNGTDQSVEQDQQATSGGSHGGGGSIDQSQEAANGNETTQNAGAEASTKQTNVNVPVSILSWGSNNGDVDQSNDADTTAYAKNENGTDQSIDQNQDAEIAGKDDHNGGYGSRCGCDDDHKGGHGSGSIDQSQSASNDNSTDQSADSTATTEQKNLNKPFSFLSWGGGGKDDCGCGSYGKGDDGGVTQHNDADTTAYAANKNGTDQSIDQNQDAEIAGKDDHNGGYGSRCGCDGDHKGGHGSGSITQDQSASNANSTDQSADSTATTEQKNLNKPFSIFSWGAGGGDVDQRNVADTTATSGNVNGTYQSIDQSQTATAPAGGHECGCKPHGYEKPKHPKPCGCTPHDYEKPKHPKPCECTPHEYGKVPSFRLPYEQYPPKPAWSPSGITQSQTGGNTNETSQDAYSDASTKQKNLNKPFSFFSWSGGKHDCGCSDHGYGKGDGHGGGVKQGNHAKTGSHASNANGTGQSVEQLQDAAVGRRVSVS